MRTSLIAFAVAGAAWVVAASAASAQTIQAVQPPIAEPSPSASPVNEVEHVETPRTIAARAAAQHAALRFRPGGMLLKSFDKNNDGVVSREELAAGAAAAFEAADANHDGLVSGLEQTAWAAEYGGVNDVLSNAMMFDSNLDHMVTRDEFVAGVMRLADPVKDATGGLQVAKLMVEAKPEGGEPPPAPQSRPARDHRGG